MVCPTSEQWAKILKQCETLGFVYFFDILPKNKIKKMGLGDVIEEAKVYGFHFHISFPVKCDNDLEMFFNTHYSLVSHGYCFSPWTTYRYITRKNSVNLAFFSVSNDAVLFNMLAQY